MDVLKKNTTPTFEIVPRFNLNTSQDYIFEIVNEFTQKKETILSTVQLLPNENYSITMATFPKGKINEKLSYSILNSVGEVVSLGRFIILSETENVQDYSKQNNTKFYK